MNPRTPPRLANWLWNRFGLAHQNPPLAGDLLEEFRAGRSTAWFWRQTLRAILIGFSTNARRSRRTLTARLMGWAVATVLSLGFWLFHLPPHLEGWIAIFAGVVLLSAWLWACIGRRRRAEIPVDWSELDQDARHAGRRILMGVVAGSWFVLSLMLYSAALFLAILGPMPLWLWVCLAIDWLLTSISDIVAPRGGKASASATLLDQD